MKVDYSEIKRNLKTTSDLVEFCLDEFPETRGSDKKLALKVWELQGFRLSPEKQAMFLKVASYETVRRSRQLLQSKGLYMPDPVKTAQRSLLGMVHRKIHRDKKREADV